MVVVVVDVEVDVEVEVDGCGGVVDVVAGAVVVGAAVVVVVAIGTSEVEGTASLAEVQADTTNSNDSAASPEERTGTVIDAVARRGTNQWIQIRGGESARPKSPTELNRTNPLPAC